MGMITFVKKFFKQAKTVDAIAPTINIINKSSLVKQREFDLMVEACKIQLDQHVAPMWLKGTWNIVSNQPEDVGYPIILMDNPDQAGALGYHSQTPDGKIWGRVFAAPALKRGSLLNGPMSVSVILSHEVIEAYCDPNVNIWADTGKGTLIAYEVCDPVENDVYEVTTKDGTAVSVSNFVLPTWFDPFSAVNGNKLDFMAVLNEPLTMSKGGYTITLDAKTGVTKSVFGSLAAEEMHNEKILPHAAARSSRKKSEKNLG